MTYGSLGYRGGGCHFCGAETDRVFYRLDNDHPTSRESPPGQYALCARHRDLLRGAGPAGRVHRATGLRWFFVR